MLWRWHFYAGLVCIPFILLLSLTGTIYLFKPQGEAAIDAKYQNLTLNHAPRSASAIANAAIAAVPGSTLRFYQMPTSESQAIRVMVAKRKVETLVYVRPDNLEVVKIVPKNGRFMAIAHDIHGELLMGKTGSLFVEAAACWAIVMVVTGLYLWWPRNASGLGGLIYPRKGKLFMRDLHAVTGVWVSFFALFLLLTGLPWTEVWGDSFKAVRRITHTSAVKQDWTLSRAEEARILADETGGANHMQTNPNYLAGLDDIVASARKERLAYPVEVAPPNNRNKHWVVRSQSQNRMQRVNIEYDSQTGLELNRERFEDRHIIDKITGIGISVHEGQLFGWFNQFLGVLTAVGLCTLSVSAFIMWRRRAPDGALGAPPAIPDQKIGAGIAILIIAFAIFLPVLGVMLVIIAAIETLILRHLPPARKWLGLTA